MRHQAAPVKGQKKKIEILDATSAKLSNDYKKKFHKSDNHLSWYIMGELGSKGKNIKFE